MVQRYHFNDEYSGIHEKGNFVAYTDYAALEAERDELAARLRAVREGLGVVGANWTDEDRARGQRMVEQALDGPVPECRACADSNATVAKLSALVIKGNPFVPVGELWVNSKWDEARHAADEGGGHE